MIQEAKKTEKSGLLGIYLSSGQIKLRLKADYPDASDEKIEAMLEAILKDRSEVPGGTIEDLNVAGAKKYWYADRQGTEAGIKFIIIASDMNLFFFCCV